MEQNPEPGRDAQQRRIRHIRLAERFDVLRVEQSNLPVLFDDGFESGDCSAWTSSSPACAARR